MSYNILTRSISWVLDFIRGEPTPRRRSDRTTLRSEGVQHVGQRTEGGVRFVTIPTPSTKTRSQGI